MKLLNLGCGGVRIPSPEWTNLDDLHSQLPVGSPARAQLDSEPNYRNFVVLSGPLPFADNTFDTILASHFFEHFTAWDSVRIMEDCRRVLKPGGYLLVSVPDASYFRSIHADDRNENWERLFDVVDPNNGHPTWMRAALYFEQHFQVLTEDALWCHLKMAGYDRINRHLGGDDTEIRGEALPVAYAQLNRLKFSLIMSALKPL